MQVEPPIINVNLNTLDYLSVSSVFETIHMVGFGLAALPQSPPPYTLPEFYLTVVSGVAPGEEATKEEFRRWLIGVGLRRYVEAYSIFLENAALVASLIHRSKNSSHTWDETKERLRINKLSFPGKLEEIGKLLDVTFDNSNAVGDLESINKARNCFEHRHGWVSSLDANDPNKTALVVHWTTLMFSRQKTDGNIEPLDNPIGAVLEAGESLLTGWAPRERTFPLGGVVAFTAREFGEMGLAFIRHGMMITDVLRRSLVNSPTAAQPSQIKFEARQVEQHNPEV